MTEFTTAPASAAEPGRLAAFITQLRQRNVFKVGTTRLTTDDKTVVGMEWHPVSQAALLETIDGYRRQ